MRKKLYKPLAIGALAALTLAACSSDGDTADDAPETGTEAGTETDTDSGDDQDSAAGTGSDETDLTIAVFNGWDEAEAVSLMWQQVLNDLGYNVTLTHADAGPVFKGLADGEYDITLDGWLPITHADYMEEYGDQIIDLGPWNSEAALTVAVNEDAPITSLEELAENADEFGNQIVGIEEGAGLTRTMHESVIPHYGLEDMNFLTSSTPAMLAELMRATDAGENVVVTLWRPHWAYDAFPVRDLEDPAGQLGDVENIHAFARGDFADDFPQLATWFENWEMSSDLLYSLENDMFNDPASDDMDQIVADWIAANQDYIETLTQ